MRFGIVGDPVGHSRSPEIHNAGFAERGIDAVFDVLPTPLDRFQDVERRLREGDLNGVSVTMPHKTHAFEAVDHVAEPAARAKAVNTIVAVDGILTGHNTDIDGVRFALDKLDLPKGTPILMLGHGGAAAATIVSIVQDRPITISARERDPAMALAQRMGVSVGFIEWGRSLPDAIVVNATPLGMQGEQLPRALFDDCAGLLDMAYGANETPAVATARMKGLPFADGLDMLVGQAIAAFELFTGVAAPVDVLSAAARMR